MTSPTLAQLLEDPSEAVLLDSLLAKMAAKSLPVDAWQEGNPLRVFAEADASTMADYHQLIGLLIRAGFGDLAVDLTPDGAWLDLLMRSLFEEERLAAVFMRGTVTLVSSPLASTTNIGPGGLVLVSTSGRVYRSTNTSTVVLAPNASAVFTVQAEGPGVAYNELGNTLSLAQPAAAGLSITVGSGTTWHTRSGVDRESDRAYLTRARSKIATVGGLTETAIFYHATSAKFEDGSSVGCTRCTVPPTLINGDGSYSVVVAAKRGTLGSGGVTRIQEVLEGVAPVNDVPTVVAATETTVTVTGVVTFKPGYNINTNRTKVTEAIKAAVDAVGIGDSGIPAVLDREAIPAAIYAAVPGGISDVDLSAPSADATAAVGHIFLADTLGVTFL